MAPAVLEKVNGIHLNTCKNCGHTGTNAEVAYERAIMSKYYYEPGGNYCVDGDACKARANAKYITVRRVY